MNLRTMWKDKRERTGLVLAAAVLGVSLIFFYSFIYNDILETMRMGISFWTDLFSGRIRYFYAGRWEMTPVAYAKEVQAVYDFPIYIVFAVWNFPLWLLETFGKVDVFQSALCLMWGKTLVLVFSVLLTRCVYRLCLTLQMKPDTARLVCILLLTSNFFMSSVILMGAYDIIPLLFALEGIRCYFKNNTRGFLLCFMCAIPLKFFALLLFVPLVLLREKRIPRIIGAVFLSFLPILVFRILLPCSAVYGDPGSVSLSLGNIFHATNLSNLAFLYTMTYEQPMSLSAVFPSVVCWLVLYLICYFWKPASQEEERRAGIYVCFLTYAILFVTSMSHPYWLMILVPFTVLVMGQNPRYLYVNLVLETLFTWGMIAAQLFKFPWCFGNALAANSFLPKLFGAQETFSAVTPMTVFTKLTGSDSAQGYLIRLGCSVFLAGILIFAYVNFPFRKKELAVIERDEKPAWWLVGLRVLAGFGLALIPVVLHIAGVWL